MLLSTPARQRFSATARFAKRLFRWLHFLSQLCLSLAPPSLRLPSLSLALSLFSPVPFACDSQRLSVNVSRSAQDLQRTYAQRSLPEPDVATQVSPSSTVDPATILWVLGRVYGILSGLTDGILWPTWGSSGPLGTNRDERARGSQNGPEDPRRAGGSQPRPHEAGKLAPWERNYPRKPPRPQVPGRTGHRIPARKVVARYVPSWFVCQFASQPSLWRSRGACSATGYAACGRRR